MKVISERRRQSRPYTSWTNCESPCWNYLLLPVQVHTTHYTFYGRTIGPHAGAIYSWLFKYTQHTASFTGEQLDPMLELSTPGCSSTHNTLQVLRENNWAPCWSYLLLAVQEHTTHWKFYGRTIGPASPKVGPVRRTHKLDIYVCIII
jgi:hypothetical protein